MSKPLELVQLGKNAHFDCSRIIFIRPILANFGNSHPRARVMIMAVNNVLPDLVKETGNTNREVFEHTSLQVRVRSRGPLGAAVLSERRSPSVAGDYARTNHRRFAASRCLHILKLLVLCMLITPAATVVFAADILGPSAGSVNQLQALGSVKDYVGGDSDSVGDSEDQVPILGIEITNGQSRLARGPYVGGIKVISVNPDSPAAIAGLQSEHTAVRTALTATLAAGGMFFPPAMFGAI